MQLTTLFTIVMVTLSGFALAAPTPVAAPAGAKAASIKKLSGLKLGKFGSTKRDIED
ncbi:hypothetical protein TWF569_011759 [Orbilia oligospora]|uniref:Uncharacterized protein n=1 Tax=Orbilia oligospora TaxID=2813651 RepID=A0A7C8J8U1_ORBOL|nr:hypothetical protein TWF102_004450 [Orbilia oligospora]KAF3103763.1 hypothetical protein TWF706_004805 [Orbilia oligospora]KAF3110350.1 hypothetical protein TWF103_004640 [Orbilia oligospora]KAF3122503.1 hypothetical protein TWF594_002796 [Orbilia oligospora]KAF3127394.1 hypothetical protein TWF569_011759 [Orbilia oligospora]